MFRVAFLCQFFRKVGSALQIEMFDSVWRREANQKGLRTAVRSPKLSRLKVKRP